MRQKKNLAFLLNTDLGRKGITDTDFLPQAGDYYAACKLVHMADMITHHPTMYTKQGGEAYKQEAMVQMIDQLRDFLDHNYVLPNPPPRVMYEACNKAAVVGIPPPGKNATPFTVIVDA